MSTEVLKTFSPGFFKRLCAIHSKSSSNENLQPKSEQIIFFFFKGVLKATIINLDSW